MTYISRDAEVARLKEEIKMWRERAAKATKSHRHLYWKLYRKLTKVTKSRGMWKLRYTQSKARIKELEKLVVSSRNTPIT